MHGRRQASRIEAVIPQSLPSAKLVIKKGNGVSHRG